MMRMETRVLIPSSLSVDIIKEEPIQIKKEKFSDQEEEQEPSSSSSPSFHKNKNKSRRRRNNRNNKTKRNLDDDDDKDDEETDEVGVTTSSSDDDDDEEYQIGTSFQQSRKENSGDKSGRIRIIAKHHLPKGTRFHANEGSIQLIPSLNEEQLPPLTPHDIRLVFGCVDRLILEESGNKLRLCNWLRFLGTTTTTQKEPNILASFHGDQVYFTLTQDIHSLQELVASFDISSLAQLHQNHQQVVKDTPLDLSSSTTTIEDKLLPYHQVQDKHKIQEKANLLTYEADKGKFSSSSFSISAVLGRPPKNDATTAPTGRGSIPILRTRGRERSLLPCEVCQKAFDRPSLLKRHMRTHTGEKPHICDVCSKGFSTSSSLNTHRRIHSGEKPHQCAICGKRFTASSNLYYHRMTHNKEKPHKCIICLKSFPTPGDLKSHQYVHSGSWPFNCSICHRGFSKQTNLRNHLLLHSGDKPHNCHQCNKKFALACNLRAHLRTHEEEAQAAAVAVAKSNLASTTCASSSSLLSPISRHSPKSAFASTSTTPGQLYGHSHHLSLPPTNPFLEQLFQWNYSFAKETAGSLNMMQQKLLESQMLAAHLMIGSGGGGSRSSSASNSDHQRLFPFSVSDLLRASTASRFPLSLNMTHSDPAQQHEHQPLLQPHPLFPTTDLSSLNKFMQQ